MKASAPYEILGIGNAFVDYLVRVPYDFLDNLDGTKHGMLIVDQNILSKTLESTLQTPIVAAGGSGANVLKGLAALDHRCAFLGAIGKDEVAQQFFRSLAEHGISSLLVEKEASSPQVLCLIDPQGHRTFRTYLGAAELLKPDDLEEEFFIGTQWVHVEGYSLSIPEITRHAIQQAKKAQALVSLDLASHETVTQHYTELMEILALRPTLIFCNEDEAIAFSLDSAAAGCRMLKEYCEVAVVSLGTKGCLVGSKDGIEAFPAYPAKALDTTGAGDFFSSGFIHGYMSKHPLAKCAHYGAILGNAVVQGVGAEIPSSLLANVRQAILS